MTRNVLIVCAALMAAAPASAQTAKPTASDALMAKEHQMLDALQAHDAKTFFGMIAPGTWAVDEGGPMQIEEFRKSWDQVKVETFKMSNVKVVKVDATTSLVVYTLDQKGSFGGQPFPPTVYASTLWTRNGAGWRAVYHQESTAAKR